MFLTGQSIRLRYLTATAPVMFLLVLGIWLVLDHPVSRVIDGLSERFATQQVKYDEGQTLHPLLQEIVLAQKPTRSPSIVDWALDEDDPVKAARGTAELESFRLVFWDGS